MTCSNLTKTETGFAAATAAGHPRTVADTAAQAEALGVRWAGVHRAGMARGVDAVLAGGDGCSVPVIYASSCWL